MSDINGNQPNGESILREMFRIVNKCGPWIKCYGGLQPRFERFSIQIILEENSLTDAYLFISKDSGAINSNYVQIPQDLECSLFPVSRLITLSYTAEKLKLVFEDHQGMTLIFDNTCFEQSCHNLEIFVSQFRICASVSKNSIEDEKLRLHNDSFLTKYNIPESQIQDIKFYDAFSIPTCVFPIIYDHDGAGETWIKRSRDLNASFFTEPVEITVCCYTWNVGEGGNPVEDPDVMRDFTELAKGNYDIYFFAFQEIDMSFQAVVSGNSPMADEWTKCIKMAFSTERRKSEKLPPIPKKQEKVPKLASNPVQHKPKVNLTTTKQNPFNTMSNIPKQDIIPKNDQNPFNSSGQICQQENMNPFNSMGQIPKQEMPSQPLNPFNSIGQKSPQNSNVDLNEKEDSLISFDNLEPPPTSSTNNNGMSSAANDLIDLTFNDSSSDQKQQQNNFDLDFLIGQQNQQQNNQSQNLRLNQNNNSGFNSNLMAFSNSSMNNTNQNFNQIPNQNFNQNPNQGSSPNFNQNPNQGSSQNFNQNPYQNSNPNQNFNQRSSQNINQNPNQNFNQNPYQNSNSSQSLNQNPNQNFNQGSNQNSNPDLNQYPNPNLNQNTNRYPNQNPYLRQSPNQYSNQNFNQYSNQNPNQNFNRGSNQNFNQNSNPNLNQYPNPNQNPNQNSNPNFSQYPNLRLNQNPNQNPNQNFNQNSNPNLSLNQNPNQNSNQNLNQNSNPNLRLNQNPNQNSNQNFNQNPNQNFNQNPNQNLNQNSNQTFNQNPNQNFNRNPNQNYNRYPNPNLNQNPNPNFYRSPQHSSNPNINQSYNQNSNTNSNQNFYQNQNHNSNPNINQSFNQPQSQPQPNRTQPNSIQQNSQPPKPKPTQPQPPKPKPETDSEPKNYSYKMIYPTSLGGVYACVLVRDDFPLPINFEQPKKVRLGLHGMTANKSAIVYPTKIGEFSRINFIGCHLTAHQGNVESRLNEMRDLLRTNLTVQSRTSNSTSSSSSNNSNSSNNSGGGWGGIYGKFHSGIEKVDFVVLIGDLNYRINMSYEECIECIKNNDLEQLISKDQLNEAKKSDPEIARFDEGPISFLPSYKFDKRSDVYDTSPKQRVPSYTDRILVVTNKNKKEDEEDEDYKSSLNNDDSSDENIEDKFIFETDIIHDLFPNAHGLQSNKHFSSDLIPNEFPSKPKFAFYFRGTNQFSDHRPVQGILVFKVPKSIPDKLKLFEESQLKKMDEMSALAMPQVEPKTSQIRVGVKKKIKFEFKNVSVAWLRWKAFAEKKNENDVVDEISINPKSGVLFPEQKCQIEIHGVKKTKNNTRTVIIESNDKIPLAFIDVTVV